MTSLFSQLCKIMLVFWAITFSIWKWRVWLNFEISLHPKNYMVFKPNTSASYLWSTGPRHVQISRLLRSGLQTWTEFRTNAGEDQPSTACAWAGSCRTCGLSNGVAVGRTASCMPRAMSSVLTTSCFLILWHAGRCWASLKWTGFRLKCS